MNFNVAIFADQNCSGFCAIIQNEYGEVMAAMLDMGPLVSNSEEAEALACRKTIEFSIDAGFSKLIIEGDNATVIRAVCSSPTNQSLLGNIIKDVKCLLIGLRYVSIKCISREGNKVAHVLARHAKNISCDLYWLEDSPPPTVNALYHDILNMYE